MTSAHSAANIQGAFAGPTRRTLLTAASIVSALMTSTAAFALPIGDTDADLFAIRSRWLAAKVNQAVRERTVCLIRAEALASLPHITTVSTLKEIHDVERARAEILSRLGRQGPQQIVDLESDPEWEEAFQAECRADGDLVETPARTMAGLAFKVAVAQNDDPMSSPELVRSILDDINAFAAAFPTLRLTT